MKDRFWQIVAATAAVIAVLFAVVTFFLSQRANNKALTVEVISNSTLLNVELSKATKDLRLIYKDRDIPNLTISQIRISNTGRQPIRSDDIEVPICINLESIEIISSKILLSNPSALAITTVNSAQSVLLSKSLLNPGDEFTVEIVSIPVKSSGPVVSGVSGRIVGVKEINFKATLEKGPASKPFWVSMFGVALGALFVGAFSMVFSFFVEYFRRKRHQKKPEV